MRVIAGSCKGQRLVAGRPKTRPCRPHAGPAGRATRPTSDRVKTIIFDTLGARIQKALILDLFAGSGALGIEALSRGARSADFVELDRAAARTIRQNLRATHLDSHARVIISDAFLFLTRHSPPEHRYNVVLADPPYGQGLGERVLFLLCERAWLARDAWVVLEESVHGQMPAVPEALRLIKRRPAGDTMLCYFAAE